MIKRCWTHSWKLKRNKESPVVFISHIKNNKILDDITQMLKYGDFDYEAAEEYEIDSVPIPEKIFRLMRKCNCAIISLNSDEQRQHKDGSYTINENILIEIGAAFLIYDKRVILLVDKILVDKKMKLPTNLQTLSHSINDKLTMEISMKLQKALTEFRSRLAANE